MEFQLLLEEASTRLQRPFLRGGRQPMQIVTDEHGYLRYTISPALHDDSDNGLLDRLEAWLFDAFVLRFGRNLVDVAPAPTIDEQLAETQRTGRPYPAALGIRAVA